jgi:hypothetical protein
MIKVRNLNVECENTENWQTCKQITTAYANEQLLMWYQWITLMLICYT